MNTFICEHPDFVVWLIGILVAILGGSCSLIIYFLKIKIRRLQSIENKLDLAIHDHDLCRESLPVRFASTSDITNICGKLDNISEKLGQFPLVYRTKDEAAREWRLMETRLTSMEQGIKAMGESASERHREVWDKLNRVVDMFRDEAQKMEGRINAVANHRQIKEEIL